MRQEGEGVGHRGFVSVVGRNLWMTNRRLVAVSSLYGVVPYTKRAVGLMDWTTACDITRPMPSIGQQSLGLRTAFSAFVIAKMNN